MARVKSKEAREKRQEKRVKSKEAREIGKIKE